MEIWKIYKRYKLKIKIITEMKIYYVGLIGNNISQNVLKRLMNLKTVIKTT